MSDPIYTNDDSLASAFRKFLGGVIEGTHSDPRFANSIALRNITGGNNMGMPSEVTDTTQVPNDFTNARERALLEQAQRDNNINRISTDIGNYITTGISIPAQRQEFVDRIGSMMDRANPDQKRYLSDIVARMDGGVLTQEDATILADEIGNELNSSKSKGSSKGREILKSFMPQQQQKSDINPSVAVHPLVINGDTVENIFDTNSWQNYRRVMDRAISGSTSNLASSYPNGIDIDLIQNTVVGDASRNDNAILDAGYRKLTGHDASTDEQKQQKEQFMNTVKNFRNKINSSGDQRISLGEAVLAVSYLANSNNYGKELTETLNLPANMSIDDMKQAVEKVNGALDFYDAQVTRDNDVAYYNQIADYTEQIQQQIINLVSQYGNVLRDPSKANTPLYKAIQNNLNKLQKEYIKAHNIYSKEATSLYKSIHNDRK